MEKFISLERVVRLLYKGSYMSAQILLRKSDKKGGLPSILLLFHDAYDKFNNTKVSMLDSVYHMTFKLL